RRYRDGARPRRVRRHRNCGRRSSPATIDILIGDEPHMPPSARTILSDPATRFAVAALTEAVLPGVEFGMLVTDPVFWGMNVPRGDGHPVLLIPGLLANDDYLQPLSNWLRRAGYSPIWSGLPLVRGFSQAAIGRVTERVEQEHRSTGSRVSIIGHSMGGALARSAA